MVYRCKWVVVVEQRRLFLTGRQQRDEGKQRKRIQFLELGITLVFGDGSFSEQKNERTRAKRNDHKWNPTREDKVKKGMDEKRRSRVAPFAKDLDGGLQQLFTPQALPVLRRDAQVSPLQRGLGRGGG